MNILVTGCAGFIGYHTCKKFLENTNHFVFGIDNLNSYYDINLKEYKNHIKRKDEKGAIAKKD